MGPSRRDHLLLPSWGWILLSSLPCPKKAELPSSEDSLTWELLALSPFELLLSVEGQLQPPQVGSSGSLRARPLAASLMLLPTTAQDHSLGADTQESLPWPPLSLLYLACILPFFSSLRREKT